MGADNSKQSGDGRRNGPAVPWDESESSNWNWDGSQPPAPVPTRPMEPRENPDFELYNDPHTTNRVRRPTPNTWQHYNHLVEDPYNLNDLPRNRNHQNHQQVNGHSSRPARPDSNYDSTYNEDEVIDHHGTDDVRDNDNDSLFGEPSVPPLARTRSSRVPKTKTSKTPLASRRIDTTANKGKKTSGASSAKPKTKLSPFIVTKTNKSSIINKKTSIVNSTKKNSKKPTLNFSNNNRNPPKIDSVKDPIIYKKSNTKAETLRQSYSDPLSTTMPLGDNSFIGAIKKSKKENSTTEEEDRVQPVPDVPPSPSRGPPLIPDTKPTKTGGRKKTEPRKKKKLVVKPRRSKTGTNSAHLGSTSSSTATPDPKRDTLKKTVVPKRSSAAGAASNTVLPEPVTPSSPTIVSPAQAPQPRTTIHDHPYVILDLALRIPRLRMKDLKRPRPPDQLTVNQPKPVPTPTPNPTTKKGPKSQKKKEPKSSGPNLSKQSSMTHAHRHRDQGGQRRGQKRPRSPSPSRVEEDRMPSRINKVIGPRDLVTNPGLGKIKMESDYIPILAVKPEPTVDPVGDQDREDGVGDTFGDDLFGGMPMNMGVMIEVKHEVDDGQSPVTTVEVGGKMNRNRTRTQIVYDEEGDSLFEDLETESYSIP